MEMKNVLPFLKKNFYSILLLLVTVVICFLNYKPGTWLTGWDTLHPEFNFPLNFKRLFFGVWREEQGLGAVAAHAHMADLPRVLVLCIFSLVFPLNTLRYLYIFLCLILGPLGVYYFLRHTIANFTSEESPLNIVEASSAAFSGALFYLFNLGTLQNFYVPFEMFCVQFAALGWLFLLATKFFESGRKNDLVCFSLVTLLATPQAYASTLFYVYLLGLFLYFFFLLFRKIIKKDFGFLKRFFLIFLLTFLVNSFWLLPNLYFLKTSANEVADAKINQIFSEEAFLKNQKFGTLADASVLKNFLFDWRKSEDFSFTFLLGKWIDYLHAPPIYLIGYFAFVFVILGLLFSLFKKDKIGFAFLPVFLVCLFFIVGMNSFLAPTYEALRKVSIFKEALRMPFTKFSLLLGFAFSYYFAFGNKLLLSFFDKIFRRKFILLPLFWLFAFCLYMKPYFQGELIGSLLKLKIPDEYFQTFNWFNQQKNLGRIACFPSPNYAGWEYYRWGFQGAGFYWFGEKMPYLARDFDRWNRDNENFYNEISYALYSKNLALFEKVLEKYQVSYLLVDASVINPVAGKSVYYNELEQLLSDSKKVSLAQTFDKIKIYRVDLGSQPKDFVFLTQNLPSVGPIYQWNNLDQANSDFGNYLSVSTFHLSPLTSDIYYPFRSLFSNRDPKDWEYKVEDMGDHFSFQANIPKEYSGGELSLPALKETEISEVNPDNLSEKRILLPSIYLDGELIITSTPSAVIPLPYIKNGDFEVRIPKIDGLFAYDSSFQSGLINQSPQTCSQEKVGQYYLEKKNEGGKNFLEFQSLNSSSCLDIDLLSLPEELGYLIQVEAKNKACRGLLFELVNYNSKKSDLYLYLPNDQQWMKYLFIQPPMEKYGLGYSLHFDNVSIGREETFNDLARVTVNPIPYKFLTGIKVVKESRHLPGEVAPAVHLEGEGMVSNFRVEHPNESFYKVEIPNTQPLTPSTYLVLSQSFSKDWLAFEKTGKFSFRKLENHVMVNNWENGWKLDSNQELVNSEQSKIIYLFFWPQVLEYLGFILLLVTPVIVWKSKD